MKRFIKQLSLSFQIAGWLLAGVSPATLADTLDLTENFAFLGPVNQYLCANTTNSSVGVFADVDGNNQFDTLVVFTSLEGEAIPSGPASDPFYGLYNFFFSGNALHCGGATTVGRIGIRFVDMLAPGFNPNNSTMWVYKRVPGVQLVVWGDLNANASNPYRQVKAYTELQQGGVLVGSFTGVNLPTCDFTHTDGVKEILIRSDFVENGVYHLVIHSNGASGGADVGLRVRDGGSTVRIACELPAPDGSVLSPVRFQKNGSKYGVILTDLDSPSASRIRVRTNSGTKAWMRLP